jgi:methylglutaconyl-CoA hydratase
MNRSEDRILVHQDSRNVVTLTLNRPDRNNAYDGPLLEQAHAALDSLEHSAHARVLVIRGEGRHFQAGADLAWLNGLSTQSPEANLAASQLTSGLMRRLNALAIPVIALVQGGCFGGGTGLIASCDVVIAADNAQFSIAESRWGMVAGIIIPQLNDAMSIRQVRRYALTGERFDAHEARRIGLVHEVVPLQEISVAAERIIDALLRNGPQATRLTKATTLRACWSAIDDAEDRRLVQEHALKRQSDEAAEGLASFREKREADWYRKLASK